VTGAYGFRLLSMAWFGIQNSTDEPVTRPQMAAYRAFGTAGPTSRNLMCVYGIESVDLLFVSRGRSGDG
jgi:hypothetical protein